MDSLAFRGRGAGRGRVAGEEVVTGRGPGLLREAVEIRLFIDEDLVGQFEPGLVVETADRHHVAVLLDHPVEQVRAALLAKLQTEILLTRIRC